MEAAKKVKDNGTIVACIPAYNEEPNIGRIVLMTSRYVDHVIVCDDGSMDFTGDLAEALGATVVRHKENRGKGAAIKSALIKAREFNPSVVVFLDSDGQHDPAEILKIIEPIKSGKADMVVGSRYVGGSRVDAPFYRRVGLRLINALSGGSGDSGVSDTQSGFRAFSAKALEVVLGGEAEGYGVETEQLALAQKSGLRVMEVPVTIRYGGLGNTSKKNPVSHGAELLGTVLRLVVEDRPLLLLGVPGFFLTMVGVFTGGYFLWYFNTTRYFSLPLALITFGALVLGVLLIITSFILYAMSRLRSSRLVNANVSS